MRVFNDDPLSIVLNPMSRCKLSDPIPERMLGKGLVKNAAGLYPREFELDQNYPNPFNPTAVIKYGLPVDVEVSLKVYDLLGKQVAVLVHGLEKAGYHQVLLDASHLASGVYFYRIQAGSFSDVKKLLVVK